MMVNSRIGPDDKAHNTARDLMDHLDHGSLTKPARDALRQALNRADKVPAGRAGSDAAVGRRTFDVTWQMRAAAAVGGG